MEERNRKVEVVKILRETYDTSSFVLRSLGGDIPAKSGQFLTFLLNSYTGKELRRSYSLSSSPELGEPLTVTIKRIANGEVSRRFVDYLQEGEILKTTGASGMFVLPPQPEKYQSYIFFAAGSGITPIFSLLKALLYLDTGCSVLLIYSTRSIPETIFYHQITALQSRYTRTFRVRFFDSTSADLLQSRLTPALVENLLFDFKPGIENAAFYLCGPDEYMRMVYFTLLSAGVPANHVRREIFFVQQPKIPAVPPDTDAHMVTLLAGDESFSFEVKYPTTILRAARSLNIPLSFSCESGQCGTCVAKCLQGEVWMSRNEILLDEELKNGNVLTCTGYPINGNTILKI